MRQRSKLMLQDFSVSAGQKLTIVQGETVRMTVSFEYMGPAKTVTLRCSIGNVIAGVFDEVAMNRGTIPLTQATTWTPYTRYLDIDTSKLAGMNCDVEAKIEEFTSDTLTRLTDVIDVIGGAAFQNFKIVSYEKV